MNKCVREYLRARLGKDFSGYEIDRISDIQQPSDNTVAERYFHHNNFEPAKHRLVVTLRTRN